MEWANVRAYLQNIALGRIAKATKTYPDEIKVTSFRPPVKNIKMSVILGGIGDEKNR